MPAIKLTEPTFEPLTLAEAKVHLRVDASDEDAYITALISGARAACEGELNGAVCQATYRLNLDRFPDAMTGIALPFPPLLSVQTVKFYDTAGVFQTLSPSDWQIDTTSAPGWVTPGPLLIWPLTQIGRINAVQIDYTAGWPSAATIPQPIKDWMKLRLASMYANREADIMSGRGQVQSLPWLSDMLDPYRCVEY